MPVIFTTTVPSVEFGWIFTGVVRGGVKKKLNFFWNFPNRGGGFFEGSISN